MACFTVESVKGVVLSGEDKLHSGIMVNRIDQHVTEHATSRISYQDWNSACVAYAPVIRHQTSKTWRMYHFHKLRISLRLDYMRSCCHLFLGKQ